MTDDTVPTNRGPSWWHRTGSPRLSGGFILAGAMAVGWFAYGASSPDSAAAGEVTGTGAAPDDTSSLAVADRRPAFRFDTFDDEHFWVDTLQLPGRGSVVFYRSCADCRVGTTGLEENNGALGAPVETGMNGVSADRTVTRVPRMITAQQQRDLVAYLNSH